MAGYNYWFPKAFGFKLDERWGRASFWCWLIGFYIAFMPLYALGLMGMTRRMQHYDVVGWQPWLVAAAVGVVVILAGIVSQIIQLVVSIRDREQLKVTADPWNGRTLEWATASPPPAWNFAVLPQVTGHRRLLEQEAARARSKPDTDTGAQIRADRGAEEQRDRLRHRVFCGRFRLCADLAHLVDGRCRS